MGVVAKTRAQSAKHSSRLSGSKESISILTPKRTSLKSESATQDNLWAIPSLTQSTSHESKVQKTRKRYSYHAIQRNSTTKSLQPEIAEKCTLQGEDDGSIEDDRSSLHSNQIEDKDLVLSDQPRQLVWERSKSRQVANVLRTCSTMKKVISVVQMKPQAGRGDSITKDSTNIISHTEPSSFAFDDHIDPSISLLRGYNSSSTELDHGQYPLSAFQGAKVRGASAMGGNLALVERMNTATLCLKCGNLADKEMSRYRHVRAIGFKRIFRQLQENQKNEKARLIVKYTFDFWKITTKSIQSRRHSAQHRFQKHQDDLVHRCFQFWKLETWRKFRSKFEKLAHLENEFKINPDLDHGRDALCQSEREEKYNVETEGI